MISPGSEPLVKVRVDPPAGTILLNRPSVCNALSREMLRDLLQAFGDLHQDLRAKAVILTGSGDAFCAGMDLHELHATSQQEDAHAQWHDDAVLYKEVLETMWRFPKPIIAAVNGAAAAGGAGLVLGADLTVAGETATFALPEARRGLAAGLVIPHLVFRVGAAHAARLLLTGETISAEDAHRVGLFSELVPHDKLWARSMQLAEQCARCAPEALQLTKRMLNETVGEHIETLLSAGAAVSATSRTTEAAAEGVAAFLEKRDPEWV